MVSLGIMFLESRPWRSWVCGVRAKRLTGLVAIWPWMMVCGFWPCVGNCEPVGCAMGGGCLAVGLVIVGL
uniref:Uncharacterized protein n=1 Tax=Fagus sylvatica TaxID=28930 RepID=A0A2N9EGK4_FAGSY